MNSERRIANVKTKDYLYMTTAQLRKKEFQRVNCFVCNYPYNVLYLFWLFCFVFYLDTQDYFVVSYCLVSEEKMGLS